MNFSQTCVISASRQKVWDFLMDMENVSRCLPGVESMEKLEEDTYQGVYKIKVGPIALKFQGTLRFEVRDRAEWHAVMRAEAKDRRLGGGVRARLEVYLTQQGPDQTEMRVNLESRVLGKVGEFGQPVMRKKTDAILQVFARQVSESLAGEQ
jgi:carbon monoxide dehydrogenase subunit G